MNLGSISCLCMQLSYWPHIWSELVRIIILRAEWLRSSQDQKFCSCGTGRVNVPFLFCSICTGNSWIEFTPSLGVNHSIPLTQFCWAEQVKPWIKTSLAPGSGAVTLYLEKRYAAQLRRISDGISCLLFLQMRAEYDLPTPYVFLAVCDVMLLDGLKPKHFVFHLQWWWWNH